MPGSLPPARRRQPSATALLSWPWNPAAKPPGRGMLSGPLEQYVRPPLFLHTRICTACMDHPGKRKKMRVADKKG